MSLLVLLLFVIKIVNIFSARILVVVPTPSLSHQVVFRPLTQELARRGHEVVVVTTDPAFEEGKAPGNLTEIDVHNVSYPAWRKNVLKHANGVAGDWMKQLEAVLKALVTVFMDQTQTEKIQRMLKYEKDHFDLLLLEACTPFALGWSHVFSAPVISVSSVSFTMNSNEYMGVPSHPFLYPSILRHRVYNLTIWEKIIELYKVIALKNRYRFYYRSNMALKKLFGPDIPPISHLVKNIHMLFLNVNPIWEDNRPVPPNVIYIGGIHQVASNRLPTDLHTYLNSSKNGVIYMSLGTNVQFSLLSPEKIQIFIKVFSLLPYDVLWKWDKDELPGKPENVKIAKWLPQSDLLKHPKIKVFITQGGLQSTEEAINAGVPLVGLPMFFDQWYNTEKYVHHKIGIKLDMETLNEEELKNAILTVAEDASYHQNVMRLRDLMEDQPQKPLERAVWWIEYTLRHGGAKHLFSPAAHMSWAEYLELKLIFILVSALLIILTLLLFTVSKMYNIILYRLVKRDKVKRS